MFLDLSGHGVDGARTRDLPRVRRTLSRLSYHPISAQAAGSFVRIKVLYTCLLKNALFFCRMSLHRLLDISWISPGCLLEISWRLLMPFPGRRALTLEPAASHDTVFPAMFPAHEIAGQWCSTPSFYRHSTWEQEADASEDRR